MKQFSFIGWLAALVILALAQWDASACAVCYGKSDSALARGMNMGIFTLLAVITSVLVTITSFFVYLARRSSKLSAASVQNSEPSN